MGHQEQVNITIPFAIKIAIHEAHIHTRTHTHINVEGFIISSQKTIYTYVMHACTLCVISIMYILYL